MAASRRLKASRLVPKYLKRARSLRQKLLTNAFVDLHDHRRTVLLAGTGRSGTTWIGDIINHDNSYRVMFEPFHSREVPLLKHFAYNQYLRPGNRDKRFAEPIKAVLAGRVRHDWIDKYNRRRFATKRLIKDIRVNFMLKWIKANFPDIPIILLLRHPCAVAHSRLKLGWGLQKFENLIAQDALMADFLEPFRPLMENTHDLFDKHVLMWCLQNYVPLKQFEPGQIHVAFYEHFCTQPQAEIEKMFSFLGVPADSQKLLDAINRPSALSRQGSAVLLGQSLTESWRKEVGKEQLRRAVATLSLFGLHHLYGEESMPLVATDLVPRELVARDLVARGDGQRARAQEATPRGSGDRRSAAT